MKDEKSIKAELDSDELKASLSSKFSNFWYFYKWQTIFGVIILIGIIAAVVQMSNTTEPDAAVMYVGPSYLTVKDKETIADTAQNYMIDYNDDGQKSFSLLDVNIAVATPELAAYANQINAEAQKRFMTEVVAGDSLIYILEESFFRKLIEQDCLAKLTDVLDSGMIPENSEEYGVKLKELPFFGQAGFSSFPDDAYICIRRAAKDGDINHGRTNEYWNSNKVFFRSVFAYRKN